MRIFIVMYEDGSKILGTFSSVGKACLFIRSILGENAQATESPKGELWTDGFFSRYVVVSQYVY